jgi:ABC-type transport system involved in multi-copper enzyme maturation permease subunit
MRLRLLDAARRIFELTLGQVLWARRTWFMALAASAPVLLGVLARITVASETSVVIINGNRVGTEMMFASAVSVLYLRFIGPALGVFYGTSMIAEEVEEKTITYLFTRPIPRGAIVLGKYLAYLLCVVAVLLPSVAVMFVVMVPFRDMAPLVRTLLADLGSVALGLAAYGAVFLWAGTALKRPLVAGLIFVFGWEQFALLLPGYLRYLTIAYYLQTATRDAASLIVVTAVALMAAMWTIERREYVLEQ